MKKSLNQSVLGEIYLSLTKSELKKLTSYLEHSQWNQSSTVVSANQYYAKNTKKSKLRGNSKESLFEAIYPNEEYNDAKLRFVQNRLLNAIKEFVNIQKLNEKNIFTEKIWMDFIDEKNLRKNTLIALKQKAEPAVSDYNFLFDYFKKQEISLYEYRESKDVTKKFNTIIDVMDSADSFADLIYLKHLCTLISFKNKFRTLDEELPVGRLRRIKSSDKYSDMLEFKTYLLLVQMLLNNTESDYKKYKDVFLNNIDYWIESEKINFTIYLINFITNQINKGNSQYIDELYELYSFLEEKDIFNDASFLNHNMMNNIIYIYLRKKEYNRAKDLLENYIGIIEKNIKSPVCISICREYFLKKKEYKKSLRELLMIDYSNDSFYSLNSKVILLKNYYELNETDALLSLCVSFKEYIRKNKIISKVYKNYYNSFIKYTQKLYKSSLQNIPKIKSEIQTMQIAEKNWLLDKIAEKQK